MEHYTQPAGLPPANGYSHAVGFTGRLVVISGQVPAGPDGQVVGAGDPAAQVRQVFTNLVTALAAAGGTLAQVVKLTVFLTDLADLAVFREVRDGFLAGGPQLGAGRHGLGDDPVYVGQLPLADGVQGRSAAGQPGRVDH